MPQTTLSIRIDEDLKKSLDAICNEFGMNISTAITIYAKTVVRERRIPFEINAGNDVFYSEANQARLRQSHMQFLSGNGFVRKTLDELKEMEEND